MKALLKRLLVALAAGATVTATVAPARADVVCDDWCQAAWAQQRANALPRTGFYDPPRPLRPAPAGTLGAFIALIASGAHVADPAIEPRRLLTAEALRRLEVTRSGCLGVVSAVFRDLTGPDLVRPGYLTDPPFARFLRANRTGIRPVAGPVLLLQGEADSVIPAWMTDEVAKALRHGGSTVDYRTYPGLEHDTYPGQTVGIDDGAMPDILAWVAGRFAGGPGGAE